MQVIHPDLRSLMRLSAEFGRDITLVQGAGGNSSVKLDGVLWVKASGTWLADAERQPIFVPVDLATALQAIGDNREHIPALPGAPEGLRPSIETSLHALMPHRVVMHVHGVNSIAWSVLTDAEAKMAERLAGLRWCFVPYHRPGVPLSRMVSGVVDRERPDVLILGKHGLVVGGEDAEEVGELVREVERRLALPVREGVPPEPAHLAAISAGTPYRPAAHAESHLAATDPDSLAFPVGGSLYPDHVVFLGPAAYALQSGETPDQLARRAAAEAIPAPTCLLVPGKGVLIRDDLPRGAEEMLRCLGLVTSRLPSGARIDYLTAEDEDALLNWDAERYRRSLARS